MRFPRTEERLANRRVNANRPFALPGPRYSHSQRTMDIVRHQPLGEFGISCDGGNQLTGKSTKATREVGRPRRELVLMVRFPQKQERNGGFAITHGCFAKVGMPFQSEVEGNRCLCAGCSNGIARGPNDRLRGRSRGVTLRATQIRNRELPRWGQSCRRGRGGRRGGRGTTGQARRGRGSGRWG